MRVLYSALLMGMFVAPAVAQAQTATVKWCVDYDLVLDDAHSSLGDDYWINDNPKPARGARYVLRNSAGTTISSGWLNTSAPDPGCVTISRLQVNEQYTLQLQSRARFAGNNEIRIRPVNAPSSLFITTFSGVLITGSTTVQLTTPVDGPWNMAAAAGWAMHTQPAGLTGETFTLYSGSGGNLWGGHTVRDPSDTQAQDWCDPGGVSDVCIWNNGRNRKFLIARYLGHAMLMRVNGNQPSNYHDGAAPGNCPNYSTGDGERFDYYSREWGSAAVTEGTAAVYAGAVWNKPTELDCMYWDWWPTDPDRDGVHDEYHRTCHGGFYASSDYVPPVDYYDWVPCGAKPNMSTPVDWTRFWWAMMSIEGLYLADVFDIWAEASPHTWWSSGTSTFGYQYWPSQRIKASAHDLGFGAEYDTQTMHGVDQ